MRISITGLRLPPAVAVLASRLGGLLPLVLLVVVWSLVSSAAWYPQELLVPPRHVLDAFNELVDTGELQEHLRQSLGRLGFGMLAGCVGGILFGVLMGLSRTVEIYTAPLFHVIRQVPSIALIPILILIFGIGETFKILIVTKAAFFPVALATYTAVQGISKHFLEVAQLYRLPAPALFRHIVLPATIPPIVTGVRLALGRSWGTLVAAELLAAESGIGQMMELGRQMFRIDVVMVGVVITGLIGFSFDRTIKWVERRLVQWKVA
jgi:sulfonate transport system permease protein